MTTYTLRWVMLLMLRSPRRGLDPGGWQLACFQSVSVAPLLFPVVVAWDIELSDSIKSYTLFCVLFWSLDMLLGFVTGYVACGVAALSRTATRYLRTRLGTCCRLRCVMCAVCACVLCVWCVWCFLFSALLFLLLPFSLVLFFLSFSTLIYSRFTLLVFFLFPSSLLFSPSLLSSIFHFFSSLPSSHALLPLASSLSSSLFSGRRVFDTRSDAAATSLPTCLVHTPR